MSIRPTALMLAALACILVGVPGAKSEAASFAAAMALPARAMSDQVPLAKVGSPKAITDPSGVRLSVQVNAIENSAFPDADRPPGGGQWTVLDVTVTNTGVIPFVASAGDFLLMTPDTTIYRPDGDLNLPDQQFADQLLNPGDTVQGRVIFAIPSGTQLQLVAFQGFGMSQWVVALLNPFSYTNSNGYTVSTSNSYVATSGRPYYVPTPTIDSTLAAIRGNPRCTNIYCNGGSGYP